MSRSDVSIGLCEVICHFEELEDPRSTINGLHPDAKSLVSKLFGVLALALWPYADRMRPAMTIVFGFPIAEQTVF